MAARLDLAPERVELAAGGVGAGVHRIATLAQLVDDAGRLGHRRLHVVHLAGVRIARAARGLELAAHLLDLARATRSSSPRTLAELGLALLQRGAALLDLGATLIELGAQLVQLAARAVGLRPGVLERALGRLLFRVHAIELGLQLLDAAFELALDAGGVRRLQGRVVFGGTV